MVDGPGSHLEICWSAVRQASLNFTSWDPTGRHSTRQRELRNRLSASANPGRVERACLVFISLFSEISVCPACRISKVTVGRGWRKHENRQAEGGGEGTGEKRGAPTGDVSPHKELGIFRCQSTRGTVCSPEARIFPRTPGL